MTSIMAETLGVLCRRMDRLEEPAISPVIPASQKQGSGFALLSEDYPDQAVIVHLVCIWAAQQNTL